MSDEKDTFYITIGGVGREVDMASIRALKDRMMGGRRVRMGPCLRQWIGSRAPNAAPPSPKGLGELKKSTASKVRSRCARRAERRPHSGQVTSSVQPASSHSSMS